MQKQVVIVSKKVSSSEHDESESIFETDILGIFSTRALAESFILSVYSVDDYSEDGRPNRQGHNENGELVFESFDLIIGITAYTIEIKTERVITDF
jgi:hypothetical protein